MSTTQYKRNSVRYKFQNVRICYCHFATPTVVTNKEGKKSDPKYSVTVLLDKEKDADVINAVSGILNDLANKAWGPKGETWLQKNLLWNPLRDGDDEREDKEGFGNAMFVAAGTKPRGFTKGSTIDYSNPSAFTKYPGPALAYVEHNQVIKIGEPGFDFDEIYAGCTAHVSVDFSTYKHDSGGKGITAYLRAVLKVADGERLDGAGMANLDNEFEDEIASLALTNGSPSNGAVNSESDYGDEEFNSDDLDEGSQPVASKRTPRRTVKR